MIGQYYRKKTHGEAGGTGHSAGRAPRWSGVVQASSEGDVRAKAGANRWTA